MVFGLDHLLSEQEVAPEEVAAIREWLKREGTCLLLAPHHDVGFADDLEQRQVEYLHHGDALVPRQQRFGQYTRSLMKALDVPVHNRWGLRPALVKDTKKIAPLTAFRDFDKLGLLKNVPTLNFHPHLPHYELTSKDAKSVHLLARQPIDLDRPRLGDIDVHGTAPPSVAIEAQVGRAPGSGVAALTQGCRVRPIGDARSEPLEPRTAAHVDERMPGGQVREPGRRAPGGTASEPTPDTAAPTAA